MLDIDTFIAKAESEHTLTVPHDAVVTRFTTHRERLHIQKVYDVEPVLKQAAWWRKFNRECNGFSGLRQLRHIACIPVPVALQIIRAAAGDVKLEEKFIKKWLRHNPEYLTVENPKSF